MAEMALWIIELRNLGGQIEFMTERDLETRNYYNLGCLLARDSNTKCLAHFSLSHAAQQLSADNHGQDDSDR